MAHSNEPSTTESRPRYLTPLDDGHSTTSHFENDGAPTTSRLALGGGSKLLFLRSRSIGCHPNELSVARRGQIVVLKHPSPRLDPEQDPISRAGPTAQHSHSLTVLSPRCALRMKQNTKRLPLSGMAGTRRTLNAEQRRFQSSNQFIDCDIDRLIDSTSTATGHRTAGSTEDLKLSQHHLPRR